MPRRTFSDKIWDFFEQDDYEAARQLLEVEREKDPQNHWILTQLGVTFYEQRRYEEALQLFLASWQVLPDCPLTLWNLAGTLEMLGKITQAIGLFTWLLESEKSPEDDPCWESKEWTDALKADCVYRLGGCFQRSGKKHKAELCYRQYVQLLSIGIQGSYPLEDAQRCIRELHENGKPGWTESELRKLVHETLKLTGTTLGQGQHRLPPKLDIRKLVPSRRVARKQ